MVGGTASEQASDDLGTGDFTERLVDGFFRSWYLYLAPMVVFVALGLYSTQDIVGQYTSTGRLNATNNPYVEQPSIRGTEIGFYETPASGTARLINEQLGTDAFVDAVADRSGMSELVQTGVITRDNIRSSIRANAAGNNNLTVSASWSDPQIAFGLSNATIAGYTDYLTRTAAADSAEAFEFWTDRREVASKFVAAASDELNAYYRSLPQGPDAPERTPLQLLEIEQLTSELEGARLLENTAKTAIGDAEFSAAQAAGASSRSLLVIDAPTVAVFPSSVARDKLIEVVMFTLLGLIVMVAALVLRTSLDRTVRSAAQLGMSVGTTTVVAVPYLRELRARKSAPTSTRTAA